ncbi:efflux RND transporter periplasmic adaptor subunit [Hymenobacter terricola]|uniref:hypothetical protein n=1 Tax=Hymenobacter terricola TaxID=2819236 RepID=UPI001B30999F|nr:hypothetical protein [Hymenobacter terricola]
MKKIFIIGAVLGVSVFGGLVYIAPFSGVPSPAVGGDALAMDYSDSTLDSTLLVTMGVVGAGGDEPLLARTNGRVQGLFFSQSDYVRRGQVLVKLSNHTFVTAPRAGFLGPNRVMIGQYIYRNTIVTTLSRRSYLVVSLLLPTDWQEGINAGDSVRVWAAAPPARSSTGIVGTYQKQALDDARLEIILTSRAPFRIGEQAYVRLQDKRPQVAMH